MRSKLISLLGVLICLIITSISVNAQTYTELVLKNPNKAANIYYPYHRLDSVYTKSPKGYKPFYISHYGRHGSRYHSDNRFLNYAKKYLTKADSLNLLTPTGKILLQEIDSLYNAHQGMIGQLSPLGAKEHREIAARMFANFKQVFKQHDRKNINCVSSPYPRCILSMTNFTNSLQNKNPKLVFDFITGDKYFQYICNRVPYKNWNEDAQKIEDSLRNITCSYSELYSKIFVNPDKAKTELGDPQKLTMNIFLSACICEDLNFLKLNIFKFFTPQEIAEQGLVRNARYYALMGNSAELGKYSSAAAKNLVKDIVNKADTALLPNSHTAADLRFGHDTGILPLANLLAIKGMGERRKTSDAMQDWKAFEMTPMGTNLQMIFYKNKQGDILVKLLYNEKETTIHGLKPYIGNYYKWQDLRTYLEKISE